MGWHCQIFFFLRQAVCLKQNVVPIWPYNRVVPSTIYKLGQIFKPVKVDRPGQKKIKQKQTNEVKNLKKMSYVRLM